MDSKLWKLRWNIPQSQIFIAIAEPLRVESFKTLLQSEHLASARQAVGHGIENPLMVIGALPRDQGEPTGSKSRPWKTANKWFDIGGKGNILFT